MKTLGIIAEYNPFHNGHLYQINRAKELTGADHIVAAISGDFVQRGTPAWTDKYLRAEMALRCGADIVFELPAALSCSSAELFARAGVSLLTSLGFVDAICFGSECDDLPLLQEIAAFLANPPEPFDESVRRLASEGLSFPAARQRALESFWRNEVKRHPQLFSAPNTILSIEYLKAVLQLKSPLVPVLIPRRGDSYHSNALDSTFASASAIRKACAQTISQKGQEGSPIPKRQTFLRAISHTVPEDILALLQTHPDRYPVAEDDFSSLLYYRLSRLREEDTAILDMSPEILHRIKKKLPSFTSYSDFTAQIKTKQYTYSRISRVLLHCLLEITSFPALICPLSAAQQKKRPAAGAEANPPLPCVPYARLLGLRREKSSLLRGKTGIPIITKPADGFTQIADFYHAPAEPPSALSADQAELYLHYASGLYEKDIFAANLYRQVQSAALGCHLPDEYHSRPVFITGRAAQEKN